MPTVSAALIIEAARCVRDNIPFLLTNLGLMVKK